MHLDDHPLSSYAQKVKIALREKGLAFTAALPPGFGATTLEGRPPDGPFASANPRAEVPVLHDGDVTLFESTVILEYLEDKWPDPALLPPAPADRARARLTEEICDTHYEAVNWGFGEILWFKRAPGDLAASMMAVAAAQTRVLQNWLEARLGAQDWFGGERFGWADCAAAPMVNRSVHYGMAPAAGSPLARWHARLRDRPSVVETFAEFDAAAVKMAAASDHYTTGGRRREYRDHRLEWMVKSGGLEIVQAGLRDGNIRFSWPPGV